LLWPPCKSVSLQRTSFLVQWNSNSIQPSSRIIWIISVEVTILELQGVVTGKARGFFAGRNRVIIARQNLQ
jgi:hypothetical protein